MLPHICFVAGKTTNKGIEMDQRFDPGVAPVPRPRCLSPAGVGGHNEKAAAAHFPLALV